MPSNVYFSDMRAKYKENFIDKLGKLLEIAAVKRTFKKRGGNHRSKKKGGDHGEKHQE